MRKMINTEIVPNNNPGCQNDELATLIESYIENKENEKIYKDNASAENTLIKEMMHSLNINEFSTNAGTAKITEQTKETFIEDALIEFLKKNNIANDIVKTKEYVDFDALESAIYHEKISQDLVKQMASCKETKTTTVLRISKKKGD